MVVIVTARTSPSLRVVYDVHECFVDHYKKILAPFKGQPWRLNRSPCNSANTYIRAFFWTFLLISVRTRTLRTSAKKVNGGKPSGHSRRGLGAIRAVRRAYRALGVFFRRERKTISRVFSVRRFKNVLFPLLLNVGVFCSYVSR